MILKTEEKKEILLTRPNKKLWDDAEMMRKKYQMHLLGTGLTDAITRIAGHESKAMHTLRSQYAKSNRHLFSRILRPMDAVWSARGGGNYYNTSEANSNRLKNMLTNVYNDYEVREWVRAFLKPRYLDDPMGILFMEVSSKNPNTTYPTYKGTQDVFEGKLKGRKLEYLVLKTETPNILRFIDDITDQLCEIKEGKVVFYNSKDRQVYPNIFSEVPGLIISDVPKNGAEGAFESPIEDVIELAHEFLTEGSIRRMYNYKHGFPKEWRYPLACPTCAGTKYHDGGNCKTCGGTGHSVKDDPENIWVFEFPDKDGPEIKEKGGFVNPSLDYLKHAEEGLMVLEDVMFRTHWGTQQIQGGDKTEKGGEKETATGRFLDAKPVDNRRAPYSKAFEEHERFIVDKIGYANFRTQWKGATISLGRKYLNQSDDELLDKYNEGRTKGLSITALDDLWIDYLDTKFQHQQLELADQKKMMAVEPYFHFTAEQLQKLNPDPDQFAEKLLFGEWKKTLPPGKISSTTVEQLKEDLKAYVEENKPEAPEPVTDTDGKPTGVFKKKDGKRTANPSNA